MSERRYKEVYTVVDIPPNDRNPEKGSRWVRIGVAFENRDGSLNVLLDANPVNGRLNIRDPKPREDDEGGEGLPGVGE